MRAHHRIASALEELGRAAPAELAHHYFESRHLDRDGKAVEYCGAGGRRRRRGASPTRRRRRTTGTRSSARPGRRRAALRAAARRSAARSRAAASPARGARSAQAAELARTQRRPSRSPQAALGRTRATRRPARSTPRASRCWRPRSRRSGTDDALAAQLLARLANVLHFAGQGERVEALSARALELAKRSGDPVALVSALEARQTALVQSADLEQRVALARELLALAAELGDRELKALALHWHIYNLLEAGDVDDARAREPRARPPRRRAAPADLPALRVALGDDVGDARRPRRGDPGADHAHVRDRPARAGARDRHRGRRPPALRRVAPRRPGPVRGAVGGPGPRQPAARQPTGR